MTKIVIKKTNGRYSCFTCSGHAGYAQSGSDIVCAAVSILVINTINAMEIFAAEEMEVSSQEEGGIIDVKFPFPIGEKAILLMDTMVLGLQSIGQQYGKKYLRLKIEEV